MNSFGLESLTRELHSLKKKLIRDNFGMENLMRVNFGLECLIISNFGLKSLIRGKFGSEPQPETFVDVHIGLKL